MGKRRVGTRRSIAEYEALLDDLALNGDPATQAKIAGFRAPGKPKRKRGRPSIHDVKYRALARLWRDFERHNPSPLLEQKLRKFWRINCKQVRAVLGLSLNRRGRTKENQYDLLRHAVTRGNKARVKVRDDRRRKWQIAPAGLAVGAPSHTSNVLYVEMAKIALLNWHEFTL